MDGMVREKRWMGRREGGRVGDVVVGGGGVWREEGVGEGTSCNAQNRIVTRQGLELAHSTMD